MKTFIDPLELDFSGGVTKKQMIAIVSKINELVTADNKLLALEVNLNQELDDPTRTFSADQAIEASKDIRRAPGLRLRFLNSENKMVEYSYTGENLSDEEWLDPSNWDISPYLIDGGTF